MRDYLYNLATDKEEGYSAGVIRFFLLILSFFYGLVVRILIFYHSLLPQRLNCKVISVGNITLGGTGKTPLVESIARYLKQQGHKVAILTRGYKRKMSIRYPLSAIRYETTGDEPYMLQKNLGDVPVIVDADRVRSAKRAIKEYGVNAVILDDGFQQWRIKKDLEIVAIDAVNPFGNRQMIPRGILREPLSSLKRADIFVLTKTNFNPDTQKIKDCLHLINPKAMVFESVHKPVGFYDITKPQELLNVDLLKGKRAALVSGIAAPESFEKLIKDLAMCAGVSFRFPDHHNYQAEDVEKMAAQLQDKNIDIIITTEKDAVRMPYQAFPQAVKVFVLKIELQITDNEKEFFNRVWRVCVG